MVCFTLTLIIVYMIWKGGRELRAPPFGSATDNWPVVFVQQKPNGNIKV